MTITVSEQALADLWQEAKATTPLLTAREQSSQWDWICQYPSALGQGWIRKIQLREGMWLSISDYQLHDDLVIPSSDYFQGLAFGFFLQGEYIYADVLHEAGQYLVWEWQRSRHCAEGICETAVFANRYRTATGGAAIVHRE